MSNLIERHRAAARCYQDGEGNASAALCKFHNDTADEIERLSSRIVALTERTGELEAAIVSLNEIYPKRIAELEAVCIEHKNYADMFAIQKATLKQRIAELEAVVNEQAEDEGLWFIAETAPEGYLQAALRKLHRLIEGDSK